MRQSWWTAAAVAGSALLLGFGCGPRERGPRDTVRSIEVDGIVTPVMARHVARELELAEGADARAVLIRIDTPGGLVESTREMVEAILASPVPVVIWVGPPGARAASAGMFITVSGHIAAMAPGTNIGAAHPVSLGEPGGEQESGADAMADKVVNDAAAFARAIADRQGRNAQWAEQAVRESESVTASEALALDVIDLIAEDPEELLGAIDGRRVVTTAGAVDLATAGAPVTERRMTLPERVVQALANPNLAYLLLTLGMIGIVAELYNPGTWIAGLTGVVSLVLAFAALGNLPVNWAGVALLGLAGVLLVADLFTEGIGVLAFFAFAAFVLGSLLLYEPFGPPPPQLPELRVNPWLIALVSGSIAAFAAVVLRAVVRSRHVAISSGPEALVGRRGVARTDLRPLGTVEVDREPWSAVSVGGPVSAGHTVRIVRVEGVELKVEEAEGEAHP